MSTKLGVLEEFFDEGPLYIAVSNQAGGIDAAIHPILVALGEREVQDVSARAQPKAEPLEELVLEVTDLEFDEQEGVRHASARARLVYEPGTPGQPEVKSTSSWRFIAALGPIEVEELRWYLEKYAIWPSEFFRGRARRVGESLMKWGQLLYAAALPSAHTANVMNARRASGGYAHTHPIVTARPEDEACDYIDHRTSALPLVEAMEELGGLVRIQILSRQRCPPCAKNSIAPGVPISRITRSTSMATVSMSARSASTALCNRRGRVASIQNTNAHQENEIFLLCHTHLCCVLYVILHCRAQWLAQPGWTSQEHGIMF